MIFNRNNNGAAELRQLTGSYYANNNFDKIAVKVELATEDVIKLIGNAVYVRAEAHYTGTNYNLEEPTPEQAFLDKLVQHIQLPIAYLATMWHYQGNDISHEDTGRKMKIDDGSEKMAWEWMYDRDDAAALRNYHKTFDRLVRFMDANAGTLTEWAESDARKKAHSLFINRAKRFNELFPIDDSPVFYLRLVPLMREIERKHIKPVIGAEKFEQLKALLASGTEPEDDDAELIEYISDPIPLLTMAVAVKRFSLTLIPEGVVQGFISETQSRKASTPGTLDMVNAVSKTYRTDGLEILNELKKYWARVNADETIADFTDLVPQGLQTDKFFSL